MWRVPTYTLEKFQGYKHINAECFGGGAGLNLARRCMFLQLSQIQFCLGFRTLVCFYFALAVTD